MKVRLGCRDFAPEFDLREVHGQAANWDISETRNAESWPPDCAQTFREAVARARRKFAIAWD